MYSSLTIPSRKHLRDLLVLGVLALLSLAMKAQTKPDIGRYTSGQLPTSRLNAPGVAGLCLQTDGAGGVTLATCAAGGGSGTVTTFSAGNLSPLFTAAVINPTTTPSLAFTLSNITGHKFLGNNTSGTAAPAFIQPATTDLLDFNGTAPTSSGKIPIWDQPSGTYIPGDPLVQGLLPDGSTTAGNPVAIGGYDTAGTPALHRSTFINGNPAGTEYGQVVRNIPSGTQTVSVSNFPATQAISAASLPLPTGAATSANQPALVSGRTPVDPSGVTSPISAASLPLPTGAATSANQATLKSNNAGSPGAGNIGVLAAVANAAPPSLTEGNQAALSFDLAGNLRVYGHPPTVLGCYTVNGRTGTYSALSSGAILFSMRNSSSTVLEVIQRVKVNVITSTAATTAGEAERELHIIRSFSASDTGGTAVTLTGNNAKMRTSQATSTVGDMRFGQPLTAGTGTADANPVSSAMAWLPLNFTGIDIGCTGAGPTGAVWSCAGGHPVDLLNATNGQEYPIVLAQNEGIRITIGKDAMPAAAVQQTTATIGWCEMTAY